MSCSNACKVKYIKSAAFKFHWLSTIICFFLSLSIPTALTIWIFSPKHQHLFFSTILYIHIQIFPVSLQIDASSVEDFIRHHQLAEWHFFQPLILHLVKTYTIIYAVCCFGALVPQKLGCQHSLVSCCEVDPGCFLVQGSDLGPEGRINSRKASIDPELRGFLPGRNGTSLHRLDWHQGITSCPLVTSRSQDHHSPNNSNDSKTCTWSRNIKSRTRVPEEMQTEACFVSNCRGVWSQCRG